MDFCFLGSVRFLLLVVASTGVMMAGVIEADINVRMVNRMWKEVGMTGKQLDVMSDGELSLLTLVRAAARQENTPVVGVNYLTTAPGRHQQNGIVERGILSFKELMGANLFFVEQQIGSRVPFESELVKHLCLYACRMHNIHHIRVGAQVTELERMRGGPKVSKGPKRLFLLGFCVSESRPRVLEQENLNLFPQCWALFKRRRVLRNLS
ncbi:Retrovirus-related Pol polyprotein from transposon TNT 1-94 [Durusdinium trenchii]|uniref:Retrovirus-related Pol polyprotein from transposon TNT 1-94 n=1 Tax=Durusdinium trenchii TaxID=1381693 RepID=A0ABP0QL60_9DINO